MKASVTKEVCPELIVTTVILTSFFFVFMKYVQLVRIICSCLFFLIKEFFSLVFGGHDLFNPLNAESHLLYAGIISSPFTPR